MTRPLQAVLAALTDGAGTRGAVVTATGLSLDVVDAALEHLERLGRVEAHPIGAGCPTSGCGGCAMANACGGRPSPRGLIAWSVRSSA